MSGQYDTTANFGLKKPWLDQDFDLWGEHWNENVDAIDALLWTVRVSVSISDVPPANPVKGQLWFDSSNPQLYVWYVDDSSAQWVIAVAYAGGLTSDAPSDGQVYGRQNGAWHVAGGGWNAGSVAGIGNNLAIGGTTLNVANSVSLSGSIAAASVAATGAVTAGTLNVNGGFVLGSTAAAGGTVFVNGGTLPAIINSGVTAAAPVLANTALWVQGTNTPVVLIDAVASSPRLSMRRADGTQAAPATVPAGANLLNIVTHGYDGTAYSAAPQSGYLVSAINNWTTADHSTMHQWTATKSASLFNGEQMRLVNGHLLINTITDDGISNLQVAGPATATFHAEGVTNAITAAGTTQATATSLTTGLNFLGTVTAGSATGVSLPAIGTAANNVPPGTWVEIFNTTATPARVYAKGAQTVDTFGPAGVALSGNARCRYFANTGSTWVSALMGGVSA